MPARERRLKILFFGSGWPTNIGNAFIALGAIETLRAAAPDAVVTCLGTMSRWFFGPGRSSAWARRGMVTENSFVRRMKRALLGSQPAGNRRRQADERMGNALEVASMAVCDLLVYAGSCMSENFLRVQGPTIVALRRRGIPVFLLGAGGSRYTNEEIEACRRFLNSIEPVAIVSRDAETYEAYRGCAASIHRGIDCAWFLPEAFIPLPLATESYIVLNFDHNDEPHVPACGRQVIRTHHESWRPRERYFSTPNTVISDTPEDYLTLYAHADEVHSDRVHACVAALAYARQARLYADTRRSLLFNEVGADGITTSLCRVNKPFLASKKTAQIEFVRQAIRNLCGRLA